MIGVANNCYEQTVDSIRAMVSRESSAYIVYDSLATLESTQRRNRNRRPESPTDVPAHVDAACRYLMVKWCHSLCDFCRYPRDLTASAMNCVDRFVTTIPGFEVLMDRDRYQLVVMTAFYMMAKIHQLEALEPSSVARLSRGKHTKKDIEAMEMVMLAALGWRVNPPTTACFAHELLNLIPDSLMDGASRQRIAELTKLQIDLAVCDYDLSLCRPSQTAFGGLLNAMESLDAEFALHFETMVSTQVLKSTHSVNQLRDVRIGLLRAVSEDPSAAELTGALLTKRPSNGELPSSQPVGGQHLCSSACVDTSPRCVSLRIAQ